MAVRRRTSLARTARYDGIEITVALLDETLEEESAADEKLTSICEDEILPAVEAVEEVAT
jgi:ferritin-like metal-binding protein YciE